MFLEGLQPGQIFQRVERDLLGLAVNEIHIARLQVIKSLLHHFFARL